jgi:hypothetical protein
MDTIIPTTLYYWPTLAKILITHIFSFILCSLVKCNAIYAALSFSCSILQQDFKTKWQNMLSLSSCFIS